MLSNMTFASWKAIAAVMLVVFIVGQSCRKEESTKRFKVESKLIGEVKKEFLRQKLQARLSKRFSDSITIKWEPSWDKGSEKVKDSLSFVYIPLEQKQINVIQFNYLIAKKKDTLLSYYLGTYIPNADSSDNKAKMTLDSFTGGLLLEDLKTGARYFFHYKNGVPDNPKLKGIAKQSSTNTTNSFYCTYTTVCNWGGGCDDGAYATVTYSPSSNIPNAYPCQSPTYNPCSGEGGFIYWHKVGSYVIQNCPTTDPPPPPPPPSADPYGGTSGYGDQPGLFETNNQTSTPVDTNIRKIAYWCSNFTLSNRHTFVNNYYTMLDNYDRQCYNKYIMLNLEKSHRGLMSLCMNENQPQPATYNAEHHSMSFKSTFYIASNFIDHEMYHAYQNIFYKNGTAQYATGNMTGYSNIEFEAHLYKDLVAPNETPAAFFSSANSTLKTEYTNWLTELRGTPLDSFDDFGQIVDNGVTKSKYFYFLEQWKVLSSQYDKPIDYNLYPLALINMFVNSSCR